VAGLAAAFGSGAMTNPIRDIEKADVILATGTNTTENHPVLSSYVKRAVTLGEAKLIVIDPRRIELAEFADIYIQQKLGTDVAWINGLMHVIIKEDLHDKTFVADRTQGFEEVKQMVEKFTPDYVEEITGIAAEDIEETARLYAKAGVASILYCMGITQHTTGTDNVKSLANLAMLCGNLGVEGGGVNPLRGQNNVQGACDLGGLPNVFTAYQSVTDDSARKTLENKWDISGLSSKVGLTATEMIPAAHDGTIKAFYIMWKNPLVSDPDLAHAKAGFDNLDFIVVQDMFLTETAQLADVVLPARCFAEKDGTFSNTERKVQRIREAVTPPGEAKYDWEITCEIATRMGYAMSYENSEEIMKEIAQVTPSYGGISYERIEKEGLHWPCLDENHPGTPRLHVGQFPKGRGQFHAIDYIAPNELPDDDYPLALTTGRILYHYHTGTMTRKSEGLNEIAPENFIEISAVDASNLGLSENDMAKVSSRRGQVKANVVVSLKMNAGTVFMPFHFAENAANNLTNPALDPVAKIPEFKVCAIKVEKA
jgi:formate dehydrogenase alpha subunit